MHAADPPADVVEQFRLALGRTLQRQGQLEEARAQLGMAVAMNPTPDYQEALNEVRMQLAAREL